MESKLGPLQALIKFWGTLNSTQKFVCTAFISLSVVLLIIVSVVATKPHMGVLFSGLEGEDSGAVVAKLQEKGIAYVVQGTTIKIPDKLVAATRMELSSQGLPKSSNIGFEIFDKTNFGMTEFTQNVTYQRALQGELSRTINEIDGVTGSKVLIAIPKPTVFSQEEKAPTASVFLKLRPGTNLSEGQVGGIVHLISSAVEGLKPNNVDITDSEGNLLHEASDEAGLDPRMSASKLKMKREYEKQVEKDIQTMLERVIGPGKAVVRVNAKLNLDRKESSSELYQPMTTDSTGGVLTSEDTTTETYSDKNPSIGGTVGIRAGVGGNASAISAIQKDGGYERTQKSNRYEVSKTTRHIVEAPGDVEQISVAVLLDSKVDAGKIPAIKNAVIAATGADETVTSKDKISVESVAFDDTAAKAEDKEMKALAAKDTYLGVGKMLGAVLLLFGFLFFLKALLARVNIALPEPVIVQEVPMGGMDGNQSAAAVAEAYRKAAESGPVAAAASQIPQMPPEEVAQVLKKWMTEN